MEVQQIIKYNDRKYILEKTYPNFYLYSELSKPEIKICFSEWDLKHLNEDKKTGRPEIY